MLLYIITYSLCNKENSECLKIIIISSVVFSIAVLISLVVSIIYTPQQVTYCLSSCHGVDVNVDMFSLNNTITIVVY